MKIDPGMHIGLHLVFFGKTGVTILNGALLWWSAALLDRLLAFVLHGFGVFSSGAGEKM
jgi:hypothetical protein